jgi:hypothetical protein
MYVDGTLQNAFASGNVYEAGGYTIGRLLGHSSGLNYTGFLKRLAVFTVEHNGTDVATNSTSFIA